MIFLDTSAAINLIRELYEQQHDIWTFIREMDIAITPMVVDELSKQKLKIRKLDREFGGGGGKSWLLIREFIKQVEVKQRRIDENTTLRMVEQSREYRNLLPREDAIIFQEFLELSSESDKLITTDEDFHKKELQNIATERKRKVVYINSKEQRIKDKVSDRHF